VRYSASRYSLYHAPECVNGHTSPPTSNSATSTWTRPPAIVIAVAAHLRRLDPADPTPEPADIAAALRLKQADVTLALRLLDQPSVSLDQPVTGRSGDEIGREHQGRCLQSG
jgi:hypothetical protein